MKELCAKPLDAIIVGAGFSGIYQLLACVKSLDSEQFLRLAQALVALGTGTDILVLDVT